MGPCLAVLDVDSNTPAAFDDVDRRALDALCAELGRGLADRRDRRRIGGGSAVFDR